MAPSAPGLPSTPGVVTLSAEERKAGKWSRANLQRALELFHRDGLIVMSDIVPKEDLLKLKENMMATAKSVLEEKAGNPGRFNHGIMSNFLQAPPLSTPELLFPSVYQNPFVIQIAEKYLGGGQIRMPFITANTAIARTTQKQPIHKDCSFSAPSAPFMCISNFLLDDFLPSNGSTEFWLGSHAATSPAEQYWRSPESLAPTCDIIPDFLEERRQSRPPSQVEIPFGSVLLRDPRTWHAGMPNLSEQDRIMVAVAYQAEWFTEDRRFKAPESARALLTSSPNIIPLCDFYPDEEWNTFCQSWGNGEPMDLVYGPKPEGWVTIGDVAPKDKVINASYNVHAKG